MNPARLLLVIPCYNEEAILHHTYGTLKEYYAGLESRAD